ncbi:MAG: PAS domain S-box protein [candidate division Zixibacteria bacterium]|nr:PAS domain S-box protein [candidate division Zixibacteria bacterium]
MIGNIKLLLFSKNPDCSGKIAGFLEDSEYPIEATCVSDLDSFSDKLENGYDALLLCLGADGVDNAENIGQFSKHFKLAPAIIILGGQNEKLGIKAMEQGACDYLMFDNLDRLIPVIMREIKRAEQDSALNKVEQFPDLEQSQLKMIFDSIDEIVYICDPDTYELLYVNEAVKKSFGDIKGQKCHKALQKLDKPCPFCSNEYIFGENLGKSYIWEFRNKKNNHWYRCIDKAIRWHDGRMVRYEMAIDITEQKLAQESLMENESKFRSIVELSADGIILTDENGNIIEWNKSQEKITGLRKEEVIGRPGWEIQYRVTPRHKQSSEMVKALRNLTEEILETGIMPGNQTLRETEIELEDGKVRYIQEIAFPIKTDKGFKICSVTRDVSEQKHIENELRKSEDLLIKVIEGIPIGVWVADCDFNIQLWNRGQEDMTGVSRYDVIGENIFEHFPSLEKSGLRDKYENVVRSGKPLRLRDCPFYDPDSDRIEFYLNIWANPLRNSSGAINGIVTAVEDITERKKAEKSLRENKEKRKIISELTSDYVYSAVIGEDGVSKPEWMSGAVQKITGYRFDELITEDDFWNMNVVHPDDRHLKDQALSTLRPDRTAMLEYRIITKDGQIRWIKDYFKLIKEQDTKNKIRLLGAVQDITAQKNAEDALRASEEKFKELSEMLPQTVFELDINGNFTYVNKHGLEFSGYTQEDIDAGLNVLELFEGDEKNTIASKLKESISGKGVGGIEYHMVKKDGSIANVIIYGNPILRKGKPLGLRGIVVDITEKKNLQDFIERAKRLETAGRVASQIAHDFNNLLGPIIAYPELIKESVAEDDPAREYLDSIEKSAEQISDINQQLLTLGRRGNLQTEPLCVNKIVDFIVSQLKPVPESLDIELDLCDNPFKFMGGSSQIVRVVSNLVTNACDAMENNGTLSIKTENYYVDIESGEYGRIPQGEYVKLTISDTGCGIPEDIKSRIFEPFFTTKTADKKRGSGLGLSVVHSVLKDHNAFIDLQSSREEGTSFYLYFPIVRQDECKKQEDKFPCGNETILVADDDDIQRELSSTILKKLGYRVRTAENGEKALANIEKNEYDLLILDIIMPGELDGLQVLRKTLERNPAQNAIVISGDQRQDKIGEALDIGAKGYIRKPFTLKSLASEVRNVLDAHRVTDNISISS